MTLLAKKKSPLAGKARLAIKEEIHAILNCMQEGVEVVDAQGNVVYVNPAFFAISGIQPEERIGKNVFKVHPDGLLVRVLTTGVPLTGERIGVPGRKKHVVANATPIYRDGCLLGGVLVCYDISEIINLSKKLTELETIKDSLYTRLGVARYTFEEIIGKSASLQQTVKTARKIALSDAAVLIEGESGVGKELFAHSIHQFSTRCNYPFIAVNCAAIPENLLEGEIFGYEKGAFTGATQKRVGLFELANNGTIFLDEIGDLDVNLQAKLLRVLQDQEIRRLGGTETIKINVRIIAATNQNLSGLIAEGKFRKDLYYRLSTAPLEIPPLRVRKEDIPLLVDYFLNRLSRSGRKGNYRVAEKALELLILYDWPGNVRELESVIHYACLVCEGGVITAADILPKLPYREEPAGRNDSKKIKPLQEVEKETIFAALSLFGTTVEGKRKAAGALGISLATLYNKLKHYRLSF